METFTAAAARLVAEGSEGDVRSRAWQRFLAEGLPTTSDEVWRYAPLSDLDLDHYAPASGNPGRTSALGESLALASAVVVDVVDGRLESAGECEGLRIVTDVRGLEGVDDEVESLSGDAFSLLNLSLSPSTVCLEVAAGVTLSGLVLVRLRSESPATFPRLRITMGERSRARVLELHEGAAQGLVAPLAQYVVGEGADLELTVLQSYELSAWHVARTIARVERDGVLRQSVIGLGGHYDRSRNDAVLAGAGSSNLLRTTFLGVDDQVHDFRSHQLHLGSRTRATLLSKGAVGGSSRSVYTGLIEIEKGAKRTDARQTNHNLLLSPKAHADSVPNLDIRENDVACAHASSVGPLDEMQRWYLESRGVARPEAERLMIQGFFNEMLEDLPDALVRAVESEVGERLSRMTR